MYPRPIQEIRIFDETRVGISRDLRTGKKVQHGLGRVGDDLRPYLDTRTEGYFLALDPADLPPVRIILHRETPLKSGKFRTRRGRWADAGAPDVIEEVK